MGRRFQWDKKTLSWGMTAFLVIACAIVFYMALSHLAVLKGFLLRVVKILSPFLWGLVIAYLLTPLMRQAEKGLFLPLCSRLSRGGGKGLARGLSVLLAELVLLAVLTALVSMILPQLYRSLETIVVNSNHYLTKLRGWLTGLLRDYPEIEQYAAELLLELNTGLVDWIRSTLLPGLGGLVGNLTAGVYYVLQALYNLVIGLVVSVYVLAKPEKLAAGARRLLYSLFKPRTAEKIRSTLALTNRTFMSFFSGMLLDSALVGLVCYIGCVLFRMPYALLISVIIGLTNIIPFFGPFIGAAPCAVLILVVSPVKCLIFILFILVLQQIDGNLISPRILGSSVNISGFWVMFAIVLGAGLFGFWGMLLGVPVFVVLRSLLNGRIEKKLKKSDLPWEVTAYMDLDHIDPILHEPVKKMGQE